MEMIPFPFDHDQIHEMTKRLMIFSSSDDGIPVPLSYALMGDWELLILYIQLVPILHKEVRAFIVDVLEGKISRPKNRPRRAAKIIRDQQIIYCVNAWKKIMSRDDAIWKACEVFKVGTRTVERALERERALDRELLRLENESKRLNDSK